MFGREATTGLLLLLIHLFQHLLLLLHSLLLRFLPFLHFPQFPHFRHLQCFLQYGNTGQHFQMASLNRDTTRQTLPVKSSNRELLMPWLWTQLHTCG